MWGQWNEGNSSGAGAQQYTIVFDQLREERRAPPTPGNDQLQRPTPNPPTHHDLYDHAPKVDLHFVFSHSILAPFSQLMWSLDELMLS